MKTRLIFLVLLLIIISCETNAQTSSDYDKEKAKGEIKEVVNKMLKGNEEVNINMVIEPFLDSPDFRFLIHGYALSYNQLVDGIKPVYNTLLNQKVTVTGEKFTFLDKSTVLYTINCKLLENFKDGHSSLIDPTAILYIFKNIGSRWKIIYGAESFIKQSGLEATKAEKGPGFKWPEGKKMGLSLTFDDARLSQVDKGIPLLDKYGVKATFYLSPDNMNQKLAEWNKAVSDGHDIGNHTLFHPCSGNFAWSKDHALEDYTLEDMNQELDSASSLIKKMLGIQPVSFAFPCGQTFIGRGNMTRSYVPLISSKFETGRGWLSEGPNDPAFCDMSQLTGMELDGKSSEQIISLIEASKSSGMWLIFAGHEMNEGGFQTSLLSTVEAICKYASDPANGIWIDNVHNIAAYIKEKRGEPIFTETPVDKIPIKPPE